jgi:hypothetical protein
MVVKIWFSESTLSKVNVKPIKKSIKKPRAIVKKYSLFGNVIQFVNVFSFKEIYSLIGFCSSGIGQSKKILILKFIYFGKIDE